jgi:hypothetical protein
MQVERIKNKIAANEKLSVAQARQQQHKRSVSRIGRMNGWMCALSAFYALLNAAACRFVPPETLPTPHLSGSPARKLLHLQSGALLVLAKAPTIQCRF